MLTSRALHFLSTLKREPAVDTAVVEAAILRRIGVCPPAWLEFHDRFAGYVEPFFADHEVWGLMHERDSYVDAWDVLIEQDAAESLEAGTDGRRIFCADTHPSNGYLLRDDGEFDQRADSFSRYVEKVAAVSAFASGGPFRRVLRHQAEERRLLEKKIEEITRPEYLDEAASDRFSSLYIAPGACYLRPASQRAPDPIWVRV